MIALSGSDDLDLQVGRGGEGGPLRSLAKNTPPDPMASIANLVDVMLVFACGLMLALVVYWNLDLPKVTEVVQKEELTELSQMEDITDRMNAEGTAYTELGTVYEDPDTGKKYMISNEPGSAAEGDAAAGDAKAQHS